jgi:PKD repeat protein
MTAPLVDGSVSDTTGSTSIPLTFGTVQANGWALLAVELGNTTSTVTTPSGWTVLVPITTMGSRRFTIFGRDVGTAQSGTTVTVTISVGVSTRATLAWGRGSKVLANWVSGAVYVRGGTGTTTNTAPAITTTAADALLVAFSFEATSVAEGTTPTVGSPWTMNAYGAQGTGALNTAIETIAIASLAQAVAGASPTAVFTYPNSQASNGAAVMFGLPAAAAANAAPSASFTHSESGLQTTVDGSGSADSDGTVASYDWDWGDGTTHGTGATTSHTYAAPGTFSVKLTVTDNGGATSTATQSVTAKYPTAVARIDSAQAYVWLADGAGGKLATQVFTVGDGAGTPAQLLAKPGFVVGHMGASYDEPEGSLESITRALMYGADALMLSLQRSQDGVFFMLNDSASDGVAYLDRMHLGVADGKTLDPRAMTWSTIKSTYTMGSYWTGRGTSSPRRPWTSLAEFLAAYPTVRPVMIDPKTIPSTYWPALLNLMDANGGPSRFIAKYYITGTGWRDTAKARGYLTWGYGYGANIGGTEDWTTLAPGWDWLGLDVGTSQANWNTALAFGKPVIGHIATSKAMYDAGVGKGAAGIMASGVAEVQGFA